MKQILFISFLLVTVCCFAQDSTSTPLPQSRQLPSMAEEISNLTRRPLGLGTLKFENFIMYTVEDRGKRRAGKIYYSGEHEAVVWLEDLNRDKNLFFRATLSSPIITVTPSTNQGAELSVEMMTALGYTSSTPPSIEFLIEPEHSLETIASSECKPALASINDISHVMWVADSKSFKKTERRMLQRGLGLIFKNQTRTPALTTAIVNESWIPLGFNFEGYKFRVLSWGLDGDFTLEQDEMMINILGLDLIQVAKKYIEDLEKKDLEEKEEEVTD